MVFMLRCIYITILFMVVSGQLYEDKRCRCVCPSPASVLNNSNSDRKAYYTGNVPPSKCNCDGVILPRVGAEIKGHEMEYCPRCECKYQTRNTKLIMVVVIMLLTVMTMLAIYMGFLMCLDPLIKKRRAKFYKEMGTDESCTLLTAEQEEE